MIDDTTHSASEWLSTPALRRCIDLRVDVGTPIRVGETVGGERRVVPITGGRAIGFTVAPAAALRAESTDADTHEDALADGAAAADDIAWRARILEGGADYQLVTASGCALLQARYILETDAGDRIYVENNAIRTGPPVLVARLLRGEPVDPAAIYFRCTPRIEAAAASLRWMNERVFVGTGARLTHQVVLRFFVVE